MRQGHGRIAVVLDRSQSMDKIAEATVVGYNEFIKGQKAAPGTADVLLVQFDHEYEVVYDKPLSKVEPMSMEQFVPRGNTALRDAMGKTINRIGDELARLSEAERPDSVTVVTLTDGEDNVRNQEFSVEDVARMVKHQSEVYNWKFVFVGANQDAVLTASAYNIPAAQTMSYRTSRAGVNSTFRSLNSYTVSNRASGASGSSVMSFSDDDRAKAMATDSQDAPKDPQQK